jgi:ATP-binding protein involved in chromosome partitioning
VYARYEELIGIIESNFISYGESMPTTEEIMNALRQVMDPELGRNLVELGMIHDLQVGDGRVTFTMALTVPGCPMRDQMAANAQAVIKSLPGVQEVAINFRAMTDEERKVVLGSAAPPLPLISQFNKVKNIIAVMSGKGGVGKSSITAMLAVALVGRGQKVGVLDADVTGPSIPKLFGLQPGGLRAGPQGMLPAITSKGIKVVSTNLLLPGEDVPVVWRGPMITGAIRQFWVETIWGKLDYLLVDLPPGTSDAAITVVQTLPLNGVLLVTTPQELAAMVVRKALNMLQQLNISILGVVENMSYYPCPDTGKAHLIFGPSHVEEIAQAAGVSVWARLPLDPDLAALCDSGQVEKIVLPEVGALVDQLLQPAPLSR